MDKNKELILKMLPFFDNMISSFNYDFEEGVISSYYSDFYKMLNEINLVPLGVRGEVFDEKIHNKISETEFHNKDIPSGFVSVVKKNGYKYNGEIIRKADVLVEK